MLLYNTSKSVVKACENAFSSTIRVDKKEVEYYVLEKSYIRTSIDFNFGRYKALSAFKIDIHLGLAASVNITFSGIRSICLPFEINNCIYHMRSINVRIVRFCKTFDFNDGTVKSKCIFYYVFS